ncbi:uncharacterized protein [Antedon mediterranea]|uniref:uncharacterized protein n=1 Tax=Antedon mediterranea TaxID=105859 RepID=UPI003AF9B1CB
MDSKGGGKIQRKRTRLTAKPYSRANASSTREAGSSSGHRSGADTNQSLLKRVSNSLLGFVTPSWLTGYWTSSKPEKKAASARNVVTSAQRVTDEIDEEQIEVDSDVDAVAVTTQRQERKVTPFSSQQPLGTSTPVNDLNKFKDDVSDVSMTTSSVSMIPQVDNTDYQIKVSASNLNKTDERTSARTWTRTAETVTPRTASRPQQPSKNMQRPSFNASYFGSPITGRESPVGPFASPFYPGRTTYGGASAQRSTPSIKPSSNSPYQVYHPIKRRLKPRQASSSINSGFGVTSAAAKQILETLEKMSTPLSDAKKIPLSPTASPLVFNPTKRSRTSLRPGPPVAPRPVPTRVSIANTRQTSLVPEEPERLRKVSTGNKEPEGATPSTAKFSVQSTFKFGVPEIIASPPISKSSGGKMKTKKKSAVHVSNKEDEETEMLEEVDLPNIALPLGEGKMPSFNFLKPSSKPLKSSTPLPSTQVSKHTPSTTKTTSGLQFQFSSPIFKEGLTVAAETGVAKTFTFSSPKLAPSASPKQFSSPSTSSALKRKETNNDEDEASFGGLKPAKELKKGSCLEVLGIVPIKSSTDVTDNHKKIIGFGDRFKKAPGTWTCSTCLLDNKPSANKCIACTTSKSQARNESNTVGKKQDSVVDSGKLISVSNSGTIVASKTSSTHLQSPHRTSTSQIGFGNKFKPEPGSWNCNSCLLDNKPNRDTCVACASKKPQKSDITQPPISLAEKFKPQQGSWTCDTCLVDNKKESLKCVACTTAKPGATSQSSSIGEVQKNEISLAEKFAPVPGSWSCDTCLIQNKSSDSKCVACGTAKPGSKTESKSVLGFGDKFKAPAGSWTCDTCLIQNNKSSNKCVACGASQPGCEPVLKAPPASVFKFGGSSAQSSEDKPSSTFKFGGTSTQATSGFSFGGSNNEQSKAVTGSTAPQATSGFSFGGSNNEQSKPVAGGFTFGSKSEQSKPVTGGTAPGSTGGFTFGSKNEQSKPVAGDTAPQSTSGFTFGSKNEQSKPVAGDTAPQSTSGFTFGSKNEQSKPVAGGTAPQSTSGFTFGSKSEQSKPVAGDTAPQSTSGFIFGSKSEQSKPVTGGFTFGKKGESDSKTNSAISETSSTTDSSEKNTMETFQFGMSNTSEKPESSAGGFTFGQKSEKASVVSGGFNFGQSSATNLTQKPTSNNILGVGISSGIASSTTTKSDSSNVSTFVFGAKSNDTNSLAKTDGFQFGSNSEKSAAKEASSSAFQLAAKPASTGFSFGSKNHVDAKDTGSVFGGNKLTGNVTVNNNDLSKPNAGVAFQFGAAAQTSSAPAPFVFSGQSKEPSVEKPSTTFSFGKSTSGTDDAGIRGPPAKMGGFSFGNEKPQEPASTTNTGSLSTFGFGGNTMSAPAASTAEPPTFKFGQNPNPTAPSFVDFGATVNNSTAPTLGNSVNSTTGGVTFNDSSNNGGGGGFNFTPSNAAPKFGATSSTPTFGGQSNSTIGSSGFGMGNSNSVTFGGAGANNTPAPAFGSMAPQTNGPGGGGFQFNSDSNSKPNNSFQFGQQTNSSSLFQFGGKSSELSSTTPAPSGGFNFGSTPAVQPPNFSAFSNRGNDSMAFQFKANATNDNPFNAVSSGNVQGRKIKKAQRRIKKT